MDSVFDRLVKELSTEERKAMLSKFGEQQTVNDKPLRYEERSESEAAAIQKEFSSLSIFIRIWIIITGFLTRKGKDAVAKEFFLNRLKHKVEHAVPGLIDYRKSLVGPLMYKYIASLNSAMAVFRAPLIKAVDKNKKDYYALLGKLELEDIHARLENELEPEEIAKNYPELLPVEIRHKMEEQLDEIIKSISPSRLAVMKENTTALLRLRTLSRYPYAKILNIFPPVGKKSVSFASLKQLRNHLLELGDYLYAFIFPPSAKLLESLFIFDLYDTLDKSSGNFESELSERMDRAAEALNIIRKINTEIPWLSLLKTLAEDLDYSPRPLGGGDNWLRVYQDFWHERISRNYRIWADEKHLEELLRGLAVLWGKDFIPEVPGYRPSEFPGTFQPRHWASYSAYRVMFLEIFQGKLYHALNLIKVDGKFYKKDNQREFLEVFRAFMEQPDQIHTFEIKLRPNGEYGSRLTELKRLSSAGENTEEQVKQLIILIDRESQDLVVPSIENMKLMARLLKGILDGDGGTYDTLSNLSEIGGGGHTIFRETLQEVHNIVERSGALLNELVELEDRRKFK